MREMSLQFPTHFDLRGSGRRRRRRITPAATLLCFGMLVACKGGDAEDASSEDDGVDATTTADTAETTADDDSTTTLDDGETTLDDGETTLDDGEGDSAETGEPNCDGN